MSCGLSCNCVELEAAREIVCGPLLVKNKRLAPYFRGPPDQGFIIYLSPCPQNRALQGCSAVIFGSEDFPLDYA
jgi:hypothetical protein